MFKLLSYFKLVLICISRDATTFQRWKKEWCAVHPAEEVGEEFDEKEKAKFILYNKIR